MTDIPRLVLDTSLNAIRPLVRWLIRHGVAYPSFAAAVKQVFLDAAQDELQTRKLPQTDSALSLLSGVHRRDIRNMLRGQASSSQSATKATSLASQVVALWISDSRYCMEEGNSRVLPRQKLGEDITGSFEHLVLQVTNDVRARAVLDELLRLEVVVEKEEGIALVHDAFVPRHELPAMAALAQANIADHAAAATANLQMASDGGSFLEQAVFVDEISAASAHHMHTQATRAWKSAQASVLKEASRRFEHDRTHLPAQQRQHRVRFGVYFFSENTSENLESEENTSSASNKNKVT
jgi:Family of unknown function (DUF6502)